ncbi:peroxisome assembly factor-2 [Culex quinquefasciatus]|uniref:Peroxisome assembly factor-2 n=1 Tax=Culex quinquefasciatus TaxID=7176 RepID=B0X6T8_CULQU|nr:peroxisome assembly factor-2 [Culex quinquefasciatus]|eukprot:XP_001865360.1 peroxisome assembly factor-2 [Culex quinquefasciatus]
MREVVERNIEQLLFKRDDDFVYVSTERVVPTAQNNEASAQTRANDRQTTARFSMDVTWTRPNSDCLRQIQRNRSPTVQPGSFPDYCDHPQNKHLRHARHEGHRRSPQTRSPYVTNRRPRRKPPHGFHILLQVKTKSEFLRLLLHIIDESRIRRFIGLPPPRGFLFHGPPRSEKTLLAQAIAGQLMNGLIEIAANDSVAAILKTRRNASGRCSTSSTPSRRTGVRGKQCHRGLGRGPRDGIIAAAPKHPSDPSVALQVADTDATAVGYKDEDLTNGWSPEWRVAAEGR